jgi:hypothetical protein
MGPSDTKNKLEAKIKKLIQTELNNKNLAEDFALGGGFFDFLKEGAKIYDANAEAIKSTGLLLDSMAGPKGLAKKFAQFAETGVEIFGGIENTSKAIKDLSQNMRSFSMFQDTAQSQFVKTLAVFKELGVGVADFTGILDSARIGFQMSAEDADKLARSVGAVGAATGVGMGEAMKNFRAAQSSMAYDSGKIFENFRKLQLTSAQTGIGFEKLTSAFGESMDTFEGSASKAGTLNAILGRSVFNSVELLGQTEAERVKTIVKGIRESTSVQALSKNKFQLKAVASGLGLTVDETRKLLSGQMTVDQALAKKESKDPRERASARMAELLNKHVNPGFEFFVKQLDKMRTTTARAGVSANFSQRKVLRNLLEGTGIETPADLFIDAERALENLAARGDSGKIGELKNQMASVVAAFSEMGNPFTDSKKAGGPTAAEKRTAVMEKLKEKFKDFGTMLGEYREQGYMKPIEPDSSTKDTQRARNAVDGAGLLRELEQNVKGFIEKGQADNLLQGSTFILSLGPEEAMRFKGTIGALAAATLVGPDGKPRK